MVKTVFFLEGFPDVVMEFESVEAALEMFHTQSIGLTKYECAAMFNQGNTFLSELVHAPARLKAALAKTGVDESAFEDQNFTKKKSFFSDQIYVLVHNEFPMDMEEIYGELGGEEGELVDRIYAYVKGHTREINLDGLGI